MSLHHSDQEFELKLQIPARALEAVRDRVGSASAVRTRLQARYFDTSEGCLAAAGIALRLRREGVRWVQTLKVTPSGNPLDRLEHEVVCRGTAEPALDLSLHEGSSAGALLQAAMSRDPAVDPLELLELFRTDIQRTRRIQRVKGGTIELALDEGMIQSGEHRWPVCELEIERITGPASVVLGTAEQWIDRHGLWIDTRSKAERGHRLRKARAGSAVCPGQPMAGVPISASAGLLESRRKDSAWAVDKPGPTTLNLQQSLVQPLLPALLANASELAGGVGFEEHVHQLRVSIRRLRSVMRLGDRWGPVPPEPVSQAILMLFRQLGQARDAEVIQTEFGDALRRSGCPLDRLPGRGSDSDESVELAPLLRSRDLNRAWIWLLRLAYEPQPDIHVDAVRALIHDRLERWAIEIDQLGRQFARLEEPAQHELRKRIKRLRYALDSCALLEIPRLRQPRREYRDALTVAQAGLGHHCDLLTARDLWRQACESDPRAWFAVGWLSAEVQRGVPEVSRALKRLTKVDRRWRLPPADRD